MKNSEKTRKILIILKESIKKKVKEKLKKKS